MGGMRNISSLLSRALQSYQAEKARQEDFELKRDVKEDTLKTSALQREQLSQQIAEQSRKEKEIAEQETLDNTKVDMSIHPMVTDKPEAIQKDWLKFLSNSGYTDEKGVGTRKSLRAAIKEVTSNADLYDSLMRPTVDWYKENVLSATQELNKLRADPKTKPEVIQQTEAFVNQMREKYHTAYNNLERNLSKISGKSNEDIQMFTDASGRTVRVGEQSGAVMPVEGLEGDIKKTGAVTKKSRSIMVQDSKGNTLMFDPEERKFFDTDGNETEPEGKLHKVGTEKIPRSSGEKKPSVYAEKMETARKLAVEKYGEDVSAAQILEQFNLIGGKGGGGGLSGAGVERPGGAKKTEVPKKKSFSSLPAAKDYKGKAATDTVTGKKWKSDGKKWVEVK